MAAQIGGSRIIVNIHSTGHARITVRKRTIIKALVGVKLTGISEGALYAGVLVDLTTSTLIELIENSLFSPQFFFGSKQDESYTTTLMYKYHILYISHLCNRQ